MHPVYVILDSSIVVQDLPLEGAKAQTFIGGFPYLVDAGLGLPAVVVEEVSNKVRERLHKFRDQASTALAQVEALTFQSASFSLSDEEITEAVARYRRHLLLSFAAANVEVLPYPEVDHSTITQRAIAKRKPFAANGAGYRDCLIWMTVLEVLARHEGTVVFISSNTGDFGQSTLHADLLADLHEAGIPVERLEYYQDLQQFNERYIMPELEALEGVRRGLTSGEYEGLDLPTWVQNQLRGNLISEELLEAIGLPETSGNASVHRVNSIHNLDVQEVYRLQSSGLLILATAALDAELSISFDHADYSNYREVRELLGPPYLNPGESAHLNLPVKLSVEFEAVLDVSAQQLSEPYVHSVTSNTHIV